MLGPIVYHALLNGFNKELGHPQRKNST
jgi:hypothetical protein